MSGRKQLYKEADFSSDDAPKVSFFTTNRRGLLLLAVFILALLSWQTWQSYTVIRTTETQLIQINNIENFAKHHDEMLTMTVMMAAVTEDIDWEIRYSELDPRLTAVTKEIQHVFSTNTIDAENAVEGLRVFVSDQLNTAENTALELISKRKFDDAIELLKGQEFKEKKQAFNSGMKEFVSNARAVLENRRDHQQLKLVVAFAAINVILASTILTWLVLALYKKQKQYRIETEAKQELNDHARKWQKIFKTMDTQKKSMVLWLALRKLLRLILQFRLGSLCMNRIESFSKSMM